MKDITKKYTNGEVTIVWKPNICIHSTMCFNGLGNVFDPQKSRGLLQKEAPRNKSSIRLKNARQAPCAII